MCAKYALERRVRAREAGARQALKSAEPHAESPAQFVRVETLARSLVLDQLSHSRLLAQGEHPTPADPSGQVVCLLAAVQLAQACSSGTRAVSQVTQLNGTHVNLLSCTHWCVCIDR